MGSKERHDGYEFSELTTGNDGFPGEWNNYREATFSDWLSEKAADIYSGNQPAFHH